MIRSNWMQRLLRGLISLLGAGLGAALVLGVVQTIHLADPDQTIPFRVLVFSYAGMAVLGALIFFLLSRRMLSWIGHIVVGLERRMDALTLPQLICRIAGLAMGLLMAVLLTQILHFMGDSLFTTTLAVILYIVLMAAGYTIGRKRSDEAEKLILHSVRQPHRIKRPRLRHRHHGTAARYLVDTSTLIDGRLVSVCRLGFLEGELIIPDPVMDELRHIADQTDPARRAKGRRGLDMITELQKHIRVRVLPLEDAVDEDADATLLRLSRKLKVPVITNDYNLTKAARASGLRALNVNDLADALRPVVAAGDQLRVTIVK